MPADRAFIDTNVLAYLFTGDDARADRAEVILAAGGDISAQVLAELTHVARRKAKLAWDAIAEVRDAVLAACTVHPLTLETHLAAAKLAEDHRLTIYDAQIVAAALGCGATQLLSEDLQTGRRFGALQIVNPFAPA